MKFNLQRNLRPMRNKRLKIRIFPVILLLLGYLLFEPYWIEEKVTVFVDEDIPASFNNTKIVFISDIHHGPFFSRSRVERLVKRINRMNPDLILLGGDYVHRDSKYIEPFFEEAKKFKARLGVFGVLGNHDHWEGASLTQRWMREAGIKVLDNTAYWIEQDGVRIKLGGIGDYFVDHYTVKPTIKDVTVADFVILVSYNPDFAEELDTDKIDLMLSGHTHGGQVTLFGWWAPIIPSRHGQKYRTGLVATPNTKVLISNGIGTVTPPVRFFARPQINIIVLQNKG